MKTLVLYLSLLLPAMALQAQPAPPLGSEQVKAERARIEAARDREQARIEKEEAACYQRFAVNDCLREVHVRRREILEELRRQEIILDSADRQRQAQEQIRQIEEKAAARTGDDALQKRNAARQDNEERARRTEEKQSSGATGKAGTPPQARASAPRDRSAQSRAEEKKAFEERQSKAQERRAQRDKALAEKTGQPRKTLPDPP